MSMIWQNWINAANTAIGNIGVELTANIISMALVTIILLAVAIATRGNNLVCIIGTMIPMFFFVMIGWMNYWILIMVGLIAAALYARKVSGIFGGETQENGT